ncbi:MAG TPA: secondary thiamine-phosphate synthase enzyme YjbQ, partial [Ardenticatenaceae bacterium]|nr:secondary thiamine-phosphate synthase enzyme YjbQ [Ardenticatenaceae bacterium]
RNGAGMIRIEVQSRARRELVDITDQVRQAARSSGISDGLCVVFVPHTTAGVTLNENWDPDVQRDMLLTFADIAPNDPRHRHAEGNSPAHVLSSLVGASATLFLTAGERQLGRWQGVYLAEFDGPRTRSVWIKLLAG